MTDLLITGAAGFIGTHFTRMMAELTTLSIVALDALTYSGNLSSISDLVNSKRISFIKGDICDEELVRDIFERHDFRYLVHLAAESHVDRSIHGPRPFIHTNVNGTCVLLEAARQKWRLGVDGRRFLHVSTDEVFGSLGPAEPPFTEHSPYRPTSPYSSSKAAADHFARAWGSTYNLPIIVSNCSNNFGPLQFPEKLIPLMILNALDGRDLPIYGDGSQIRDWLHVEDHCRALKMILEGGRIGESYVIGGNCERTNLQVVRSICDAVDLLKGFSPGTTVKSLRHVADRPGHDQRYAMNPTKLRSELGWRPMYSFDDAIPPLVAWYSENREWAEMIRSGEYRHYYERQYGSNRDGSSELGQ